MVSIIRTVWMVRPRTGVNVDLLETERRNPTTTRLPYIPGDVFAARRGIPAVLTVCLSVHPLVRAAPDYSADTYQQPQHTHRAPCPAQHESENPCDHLCPSPLTKCGAEDKVNLREMMSGDFPHARRTIPRNRFRTNIFMLRQSQLSSLPHTGTPCYPLRITACINPATF